MINGKKISSKIISTLRIFYAGYPLRSIFFNSDFKFDDDFINQFLLILKSMITVSAIFVNQMKSKGIRGIIER